MKRFILGFLLFGLVTSARADVHLLGSPQVRQELRISPTMARRIVSRLNEEARLNRGGVMTIAEAKSLQAQRRKTSPEALQRQILNWLSRPQKRRLEQIELQRGGPFRFEDWLFARRVGLSSTQYKSLQPQFRAALQRYVKGIRAHVKNNASWYNRLDQRNHAARYKKYQQGFENLRLQRKASVEAALAQSLTRVQKAKWRSLCGKPFKARLIYDTQSYPMD